MTPGQTALLVIVAMLAGALLPAIVQLWLALRAATSTVQRIDRLTARLEEGHHVDRLLEAIDSLSRTVVQLQGAVRVASALGAAVGPAIGAAAQAWRSTRPDGRAPPERSGEGPGVPQQEEGKGGAS